jgi:hypothetical protein
VAEAFAVSIPGDASRPSSTSAGLKKGIFTADWLALDGDGQGLEIFQNDLSERPYRQNERSDAQRSR